MAPKTIMTGDCSALSYSRARSLALRASKDKPTLACQSPHTHAFRLRDYLGTAILRPVELPPFDPRGVRSVTNGYAPWKAAIDGRGGVSGNMFSRKANGVIPFHSFLEQKVLTCLELNPLVVEIRPQYSEFDQADWEEATQRAELRRRLTPDFHGQVAANLIISIDVVATLLIPGQDGLLYHTASVKPEAELLKTKVVSRHEKEETLRARSNSTFEIMTEHTVSLGEHRNNVRILNRMWRVQDVHQHATIAAEFSDALKMTKATGTVNHVLTMIGNRMGLSPGESYRYFAIGHYCGYLRWNHEYPFIPSSSFRLAAPPYRY